MSTPKARREILFAEMDKLGSEEINCQSCQGTCCTSVANSMQITPLEAMDILSFLKSQDRLTLELRNKLAECVERYRLDYEIPTTRGLSFRRTYTCPFFEPGPKGCNIEKGYKPYGCLAFNPKEKKATGGASCSSNMEILAQIDCDESELVEKYKILWAKKDIPSALLDLWNLGENI